jgi:hypothetical protein
VAKTNVNTAANPAAGASTAEALAGTLKPPDAPKAGPKAGPGKLWVCLEDCLLADGFHYKDFVVTAASCPPHFGPVPEPPKRDD